MVIISAIVAIGLGIYVVGYIVGVAIELFS